MREFSRSQRVGAELRRILSFVIRDDIKDPRLTAVTVQEVRVTHDLSQAKVFVTFMESDKADQSLAVLQGAAGFLRRRLGEELKIRSVPQLEFVFDKSSEEGERLSSLIDQAVARDQSSHEA